MSNTNDPKKPTPADQHTPKPDHAHREVSFEFQMPEDMDSFDGLLPVVQPGALDGDAPPLPPKPTAHQPIQGTFDFINIPEGENPLDEAAALPALPVLDASDLEFEPPLPADDAPALKRDTEILDELALPDIESYYPATDPELEEIPLAELPTVDDANADLASPEIDLELELELETALDEDALFPIAEPSSATALASPEIDLGQEEVYDADELVELDESADDVPPAMAVAEPSSATALASPEIDLESELMLEVDETPPAATPASDVGFEMAVVADEDSFSDLPPSAIAVEDDLDSESHGQAIELSKEQSPEGTRPPHDSSAILGYQEPVDPVKPASGWLGSMILRAPDGSVPVPPEQPIPPAPEVSDIFAAGRALPLFPTDSDVIEATAFGPDVPMDGPGTKESEKLPEVPPAPVAPPTNQMPIGESNYEMPAVDMSDNGLFGGDSNYDMPASGMMPGPEPTGDSKFNLPAGEVEDGSTILGGRIRDTGSIHDMPDPLAGKLSGKISGNLLFDSSHFDVFPGDPKTPARMDSPDYGGMPNNNPDASSILTDLSEPNDYLDSDSSSVRVDAPSGNRSGGRGSGDSVFDLMINDEPIPAGLFDDGSEQPSSITLGLKSASNLFADDRTEPDIDLDAEAAALNGESLAAKAELSEVEDAPEFELTKADLEAAEADFFADIYSPSESDSDVIIHTAAAPTNNDQQQPLTENLPTEAGFPDDMIFAAPDSVIDKTGESSNLQLSEQAADVELPDSPAEERLDDTQEGVVEWDASALAEDVKAARSIAHDPSLSAIMRGIADGSREMPIAKLPAQADDDDIPVVSVDWLSESMEKPSVAEPAKTSPVAKKQKPRTEVGPPTRKTAPTREPEADTYAEPSRKEAQPTKKRGGMFGGVVVGALVAGGVWAGIYFGGVIPNETQKTVQKMSPLPPGFTPEPVKVVVDPQAAFAAGEPAKALNHLRSNPPSTIPDKANAGYVRVFSKVQGVGTDEDLKTAREELKAVLNDIPALADADGMKRAVKAAVALGVSHEIAGDNKAARQVYTDAIKSMPAYASTFEALIERLDALAPTAAPGALMQLAPADAERLLIAVTLLLQEGTKKPDDVEPGVYYWKAVNLASSGKYTEAIEQITKAKTAHVARAKAIAGRGINPLSDPLEQIFARSCDDLAAYWKLRAELYGNPAVAAAIKKDGLAKALDTLLKADKDLAAALKMVEKLEGDYAKLDKDAKASDKAKIKAEADLKTAKADLKTAEMNVETAKSEIMAAEKEIKERKEVLAGVAAALKPAATLPEKWTNAELLAATKNVATLAAKPELKVLADKLTKAEAAATAANDKLAAETKRYDTDTAKLKADHAAELKKLTDGYVADAKKLKDDHADAVMKLKDGNIADIKKLTDKYALDSKKLIDDHSIAVVKLKEAHTLALTGEQAKTDAERKKAVAREVELQNQLANAVSPTQVMDLWLPTLADLRRGSDAVPALAAANKALARSSPDSEDAAKANTVAGMAHLLKGDLANAKLMFEAARNSPAYKTATDKLWAKIADQGWESLSDPVAPYRQPVVIPPVDLKAAAKSLDAGIVAYKAGRYDDATTALLDAAKNDPADPVAWYFLGATRWAQGNESQARKDFAQGAERERLSSVPTRTVSAALRPLQGATRDAIDKVRP